MDVTADLYYLICFAGKLHLLALKASTGTEENAEEKLLVGPPKERDFPLLPFMQLEFCLLIAFPARWQAGLPLSRSPSCPGTTEAMLKRSRNQGGNYYLVWYLSNEN